MAETKVGFIPNYVSKSPWLGLIVHLLKSKLIQPYLYTFYIEAELTAVYRRHSEEVSLYCSHKHYDMIRGKLKDELVA